MGLQASWWRSLWRCRASGSTGAAMAAVRDTPDRRVMPDLQAIPASPRRLLTLAVASRDRVSLDPRRRCAPASGFPTAASVSTVPHIVLVLGTIIAGGIAIAIATAGAGGGMAALMRIRVGRRTGIHTPTIPVSTIGATTAMADTTRTRRPMIPLHTATTARRIQILRKSRMAHSRLTGRRRIRLHLMLKRPRRA